MKKNGLLIVISGPAGVGKGTICKAYMDKYPDASLSRSATTRAPRVGETDGVEYDFVSKEDFEYMIDKNELIEYVNVFDNYYGTPKKYVQETTGSGKDVILEIEIVGAMNVKKMYEDAVLIFVMPPSAQVLEKRLRDRATDSDEQIKKRLSRMIEEVREMQNYDYFVVNDTVEKSVEQVRTIIEAQRLSVNRFGAKEIQYYLKSVN